MEIMNKEEKFIKFLKAMKYDSKEAVNDIYNAHNLYYSGFGYSKGSIRKKYFSYCQELIEDVIENGGTVEEIERAILFAYVVLDSEKFKLNILKAKDDLKITELYQKYVIGELEE